MYNMASLYETGTGVERDLERAIQFYTLASRTGHADSIEKLAEFKRLGIKC